MGLVVSLRLINLNCIPCNSRVINFIGHLIIAEHFSAMLLILQCLFCLLGLYNYMLILVIEISFKHLLRLGIQFIPSTAVVISISTPGSSECSQHMPLPTKRRLRTRKRGAKRRTSRIGIRNANKTQSRFCNSKGVKAKRQAE